MTAVKHAFTELPTIDIRDLAGDDLARRQAVADAIGRAAREVGFLYITGHGIDPALIAGVRAAAKQIFALPMEEKMNYYIGRSKSHKGYVPEGEEIYGAGKPDHKEAFFIDHGTGVVIGETCVIGRGCRLYQGVTLGALSFPKGADGVLIKGIPRHPKLEDDVTVYAGATILGNITIGAGSVIGANTWVTRDVPRNSKVVSGD